jgi:hypothetical protein
MNSNESLTTGQMIPSGTNSSPPEVSIDRNIIYKLIDNGIQREIQNYKILAISRFTLNIR